jgi:hypothetical protein
MIGQNGHDGPRGQEGEAGEGLIPKHGGYRNLKSFQIAQLVYDVMVRFCDRYVNKRSRTHDQIGPSGPIRGAEHCRGQRGLRDLQKDRAQIDERGPGELLKSFDSTMRIFSAIETCRSGKRATPDGLHSFSGDAGLWMRLLPGFAISVSHWDKTRGDNRNRP